MCFGSTAVRASHF